MKTLLKLAATACFSVALVTLSYGAEGKGGMKDRISMKGGKVMVYHEGKGSALEKDMTLENGTVVKTDGTVMLKGGDKMTLAEGESIDMTGAKMKARVKKEAAAAEAGKDTNAVTNTKTQGNVPNANPGGAGVGNPKSPSETNATTTRTQGGVPK